MEVSGKKLVTNMGMKHCHPCFLAQSERVFKAGQIYNKKSKDLHRKAAGQSNTLV
jgi:hypothetical protein